MTSLLERPARSKTASASAPPTLAQVNLLPPSIRARRALSRVKRRLIFALVAVLLVLAAAYAFALTQLSVATSALEDAEAETVRLTGEQAEFAEVPQVLGQLSQVESARTLGMSTDVEWAPYVLALFAVMPPDMRLSSIDMIGATPMLAPAPPTDPLQAPSVSRLTFTGRSTVVIDSAGWIDALNGVPGFADAWVSDVTVGADEDGATYFEIVSSVQVTDVAYSGRFSPEGE